MYVSETAIEEFFAQILRSFLQYWMGRERKKLKVHANEGQCDNVAEMYMACSYMIDGDYMFGMTVGPVAKVLEALEVGHHFAR